MKIGERRYRAWWVAIDRHPPGATEYDPDLYEHESRVFPSLTEAANFVRRRCLCGNPRVYVEEYQPFFDHEDQTIVPHWEEVGMYDVDPETGNPGEMDKL